jgi:hypothetical protein
MCMILFNEGAMLCPAQEGVILFNEGGYFMLKLLEIYYKFCDLKYVT